MSKHEHDKHRDNEREERLRAFVKAQSPETQKRLKKALRERGLLGKADDC